MAFLSIKDLFALIFCPSAMPDKKVEDLKAMIGKL